MATAPSTTPYFTAPYSFPARNPHPFPFPFFSPPPPPPPIPPPPAYPYAYTAATAAPAYDVPPPPPQAYYYPPPTNPYLPSASAYTPASGFSPLPPPVPNPTPPTASQIHGDLHAPPQESTAPPPTGAPGSTSPSTQPWVASSPSPGLASGPIFIPTTASASKMQPDPAPLFEPFDAFHTSTSRRQPDHAPAANPKHSSLLKLPGRDVSSSCPTFLASREVQAREEATISKNMPRAVLDLKRRLDEQQARDRTSFDKLRGELAKLTSMATQLAISIGKQSSAAESSSTTAYVSQHVFDKIPTPNSGFENCSAHPNQIQSSCVHGGSTNLREKNIEELPQAYGPHNLICRTVVRADGTEHSYYALPEDYSLKQATPLVSPTAAEHVGAKAPQFVAAQTAGQVPVCLSKANNTAGSDSPLIPSLQLPRNVQEASLVLKQMPVYGLDEEDISCLNCMDKQLDRVFHKASDNAFSEQIRRCFSKVQKTERTNANVAVYALEQEHNGETTSVNVQQLKDPQLNVLEILERRKEWDPGALLLLMSSRTQHYSCPAKLNGGEKLSLAKQDKEQLLKCFNKVSACQDVPDVYERRTCQKESEGDDKLCWEKSICRTATELPISYFPWDPGASTSFYSSKAELLGNQVETHVQQLRNPCWNVLVASEKREWDPGDTTFYALFTTADSATKLQRTNVYKPAVVQILDVQFGVRRALIFKSAVMRCDAFGLARTKVNGSALFVLVVPGSTDTSCSSPSFENMAKLLWDPGIGISCYMYLWPEMRAVKMLGKTAVPNLVHSGQTPCNLRNFLGHPVDLKQIEAYCPSNIGFVLQQGVHENYSAKQLLLYSQKYLQIKEMDIIFITHLPP